MTPFELEFHFFIGQCIGFSMFGVSITNENVRFKKSQLDFSWRHLETRFINPHTKNAYWHIWVQNRAWTINNLKNVCNLQKVWELQLFHFGPLVSHMVHRRWPKYNDLAYFWDLLQEYQDCYFKIVKIFFFKLWWSNHSNFSGSLIILIYGF